MPKCLPESFFEALSNKLLKAGLPERQVHSFVENYREYPHDDHILFELFNDHQMPSDDCFRTLAEAQKIFEAHKKRKYSDELDFIDRYLTVPFCDVIAAKNVMKTVFGQTDANVDEAYYQDPDWLFISADSVSAFANYLKTKFSDLSLVWSIYRNTALLGLKKTQQRIDTVLELLGEDIGEKVIRNDLKGEAWLFYLWFTDPIGCIAYMLESGLTPENVLYLLECEPQFLFEYKEDRKLKYHHDQRYIDFVIQKYKS